MTDSIHHAPAVRALHWILAVLVAAMAGFGWYMMTIEHEPGGPRLFALHKSVGLVFFVLMLVRIGVRRAHPPPLPRRHATLGCAQSRHG
jgi:cytochrome b561